MKRTKLLALFAVLAMVFAACTTGDGEGTDTTEAPDTDTTEPADTDTTEPSDDGGAEDGNGDEGSSGAVLDAVLERGTINCGVNDVLPGFGIVDEAGEYEGFDVDFCRAIAAGVLGDPEAVEFVPVNVNTRFTALQSGEIDVLSRNTTWTSTRDGQEGLTFLMTTFYDGQGMMVPADSGLTELEDLADANICVLTGTTTELNLNAVFGSREIPFNPVGFEDSEQLRPAYEQGQCEAWTSDRSQLAAFKFAIEEEGGDEQLIMEEIFSKEPLGPAVADGDSSWAQAVEWSIIAPVLAWEYGLDSGNIGTYDGEDANILNFIGADGFDPGLGLATDMNVTIIEAVGNYQEIYERHIEPIGIPLEDSLNDLYTNGGLMYAPPYR
ncbi:MAG: transporter substrate-binding domain-containing protein [Actinomycetota bacterium]